MNPTIILAFALVLVALVGAWVYTSANKPAPSAAGQIGAGAGSLIAGILNAAGVQ